MSNDLLSGEDVERLAKQAGLSLKDVADKAGISHTTLYRWRNGETKPRMDVYERIRDVLRSVGRVA